MSDTPGTAELLEFAMESAYIAGKRTLSYFNTGIRPDLKADNTPVTIADRESERILRERIGSRYPSHGILGEEEGETAGNSEFRWIVDPIDGTKAFVAGVPFYSVLIGVEIAGRPSVGVIYLPALDEMIAAADGLGCTWNGRRCRVSQIADLSQALVVTSSISSCIARSDAYERLASGTRLQRTWGDAYGYALVATGRAEIMMDPIVAPWDCAPMLPILREAGGRFSDWAGNPTIHGGDGIATNAALNGNVLQILTTERLRSESSAQ